MTRPIITLTTDFGTGSPYVAAMKGVILSINPEVQLIDITHAVPHQDVRQGAIVLDEVCPLFPAGTIHVAVVDPGVGTKRRIVAGPPGRARFRGSGQWAAQPFGAADAPLYNQAPDENGVLVAAGIEYVSWPGYHGAGRRSAQPGIGP